ncbi:MAG TPA: HAMP domain-containing sensor histidine kinase [Jatrophihabitantaceae bacterium]|jgi:signal transduction histidine kinase
MTWANVGTALFWAATAALGAWLLTWPLRRRSVAWLMFSVTVTGTSASTGALLGAVHSMLLPMGHQAQLVVLTVAAGGLALVGAGAAARRLSREHRSVQVGLADLAQGRTPVTSATTATRDIQNLRDQLRDTALDLRESRDRERALETSRRELVTWVSHDLRTPLAGLRAMTEALEDDLAEDPAQFYKQMSASVERLTGMVDDLFDLSRIQSGYVARHVEPVSLDDLVSDCLAALAPLAAARLVQLAGRVEHPAVVRGNAPELNRALTNLVANAIRHTREDGVVEVRVSVTPAGYGAVSVRDECGGMSADVIPRVFDVGFRGEAARPVSVEAGRAGLGLAITRGIVEAHEGTVGVENTGVGCEFRMELPAA